MGIELKGISKSYGQDGQTKVLSGIDLAVDDGESVAIIGPSGSGKSTLLNIIGALDVPDSGSVLLDDVDLAGNSESDLARIRNEKIGFVFQQHHLLPQCDVLENVLVPTVIHKASGDAEGRARELLTRVGLEARLTHRPGQLSGGECQRVAVVRALINGPSILLADEPTGSLDRTGADDLCSLLVDLNREQNVTLIVVTHSERLAERMRKQYVLRNGEISPFPG
jgi:ABC-type lipoprotein export system ATPase subunit